MGLRIGAHVWRRGTTPPLHHQTKTAVEVKNDSHFLSPILFCIMKNILFALLALFCGVASPLNAQVSAADENGIRACYNAFQAAMEKGDFATIGNLLTENAEQIIPNGEIVRGRAKIVGSMKGYLEFMKTLPKPDRQETNLLDWQNRYLAPDLIMATYHETTTLHFGAQTKTENMANAVLLRKVNGQWLVELVALTPVVPMPSDGK